MKIRKMIQPILQWWWMVIGAVVIAAGSAFFVAQTLPPVYQARTVLMVSTTIRNPDPSIYEFGIISQLTQTYVYIAYQDTVRYATQASLKLNELPKYDAKVLPSGWFFEITVIDSDPLLAQTVANELARQIILISPTTAQEAAELATRDFINRQLNELRSRITTTQDEIAKKEEELVNMVSAGDIARAQADITALESKLASYQATYADLLNTTPQRSINTLSVFEPASLPVKPIGPNKLLIILLAAFAGLVVSVGAAYLIEYLDDSVKSAEEAASLLEAPILGTIRKVSSGSGWRIVADEEDEAVVDAFRALRTNLGFLGLGKPLKRILVSSPGIGDGKSTIATNLAYILAKAGKRIMLVDVDMRRPTLQDVLGIKVDQGLSDLFLNSLDCEHMCYDLEVEGLRFIPVGEPPPNPGELIGSDRMEEILDELDLMADMVILDSSPFIVAEAAELAAKADGVVLVIRPNLTRRRMIIATREQLRRAGARLLGIVVNGIKQYNPSYPAYYGRKNSQKNNPELIAERGKGDGDDGNQPETSLPRRRGRKPKNRS